MRNGGFLKTPLKCVLFSNILNCCTIEIKDEIKNEFENVIDKDGKEKYKIKNNTNINNTLIRESDIISVPAYKFLKNEIYINIVSKYLVNPTIYNYYYYYNKKTKNNIFIPYLPYIMSGVADIANPTKDNKQTIIKNFLKNGILLDMIIRKTDKKYYEIYENINRRIIYDENGNDISNYTIFFHMDKLKTVTIPFYNKGSLIIFSYYFLFGDTGLINVNLYFNNGLTQSLNYFSNKKDYIFVDDAYYFAYPDYSNSKLDEKETDYRKEQLNNYWKMTTEAKNKIKKEMDKNF